MKFVNFPRTSYFQALDGLDSARPPDVLLLTSYFLLPTSYFPLPLPKINDYVLRGQILYLRAFYSNLKDFRTLLGLQQYHRHRNLLPKWLS